MGPGRWGPVLLLLGALEGRLGEPHRPWHVIAESLGISSRTFSLVPRRIRGLFSIMQVFQFRLATVATLLVAGCGDATDGPAAGSRYLAEYDADVRLLDSLHHGDLPILGRPVDVHRTDRGEYVIGDRSDKQIKRFSASGNQLESVGKQGAGPGEFIAVLASGQLGDSVFGWDMPSDRLTIFTPDGEYARAVSLQPPGSPRWSRVRVLDDSLLLTSGWVMGAHNRPLVRLHTRDGDPIARFLNLSELFTPPDPELLPNTAVYADGGDGLVYSALHGFDTLFVHDVEGELLATGSLEATGIEPLLDLRRVLESNEGTLRNADGSWAHDGHFTPMALAALPDSLFAVQLARLELKGGTDLLSSGGPILVYRYEGGGIIRKVAQVTTSGGLLGRTEEGGLILKWSGDHLEDIEVLELRVREVSR